MTRALEENLRRTAVEVVIPEEHRVLLEVTAPLYGVHKHTRALLTEIHHRFVGWGQTLEDLHRRATSDFYHYNRHPRCAEALGVFSDLYAKIASEGQPRSVREDAVRRWLAFLEKIVTDSDHRLATNGPVLTAALARLRALFLTDPERGVRASPSLRRLASVLAAHDTPETASVCEAGLDALATVLVRVYDDWLGRADPLEWYREAVEEGVGTEDARAERWTPASAGEPAALPAAVARIGREHLEEHRTRLDAFLREPPLRRHTSEILALPDEGAIVRDYLEVARAFGIDGSDPRRAARQRLIWLSRVLREEALGSIHESALREISRSCAAALHGGGREEGVRFLTELLSLLGRDGTAPTAPGLDLIGRLGRDVLASEDPDWVDTMVRGILRLDFHYPEFSGFTEEWGVRVNPAHLRNVRAYLSIIRTDPLLARRLLAGLVVHLRLAGAFVADTDLFQRDISALLSRDIEPVYAQVKQLLKLFPVYFNDIGAEGELRAVSTRLDEIRGRSDPLCHFVRKQSHVESNPLLVSFVEDIARFWADGDPRRLRRYVPDSLYRRLDIGHPNYRGLHAIFRHLARTDGGIDALFSLDPQALEERVTSAPAADPVDLEKAGLLFRVRREIARKYTLDHADLLERLSSFHRIDGSTVEALSRAFDEGHTAEALEILIELLERLQELIFSEGDTEAREDIYLKRHIAVGIPSMYGSYREERFEAMGLSFRIESLATAIFDEEIAGRDMTLVDRGTLVDACRWIGLLVRALRVDGCRSHGLDSCLAMLRQALEAPHVSPGQLLNIFQLFSRNVEHLVRERFIDRYEEVVETVVTRMIERGVIAHESAGDRREAVLRVSEGFLRDLIAGTFGLQILDNLIGRLLRRLADGRHAFAPVATAQRQNGSPEEWVVPIVEEEGPRDGVMRLGNKGYMLKRLRHHRFPVPDGFILTTDLFRARSGRPIRPDGPLAELVGEQVRRLERLSSSHFGDPSRPLLLSARGGGPMSMPGMLDSFLNVGINPEIADGMALRPERAWAAWDAYRRFLQFWGMSHGLNRDLFDQLIRHAKYDASVKKKALLSPAQMKALALRYRELILDHGIAVTDEPFPQLLACIELVLRSWDSENTQMYRHEMQISDDWGTAVIVQTMVFGNLHSRSGTGVALTREPTQGAQSVELHGDFIIQSQGDDVVSGLVTTVPLTRAQMGGASQTEAQPLDESFPDIYGELHGIARSLIVHHRLNHQEIEFTFQSDQPGDLFILQTRDIVLSEKSTVATFESTPRLARSRVAVGIGAAGGALSGRVAVSSTQIGMVRERYPDDPIILLRPDTVPDDIPLVLAADGLLTAVGGATSHAAVVAKRLGKTCVVGCRQLEVDEPEGRAELAGRAIAAGDLLSISGMDGSVYLGEHPIRIARVQGPARQ